MDAGSDNRTRIGGFGADSQDNSQKQGLACLASHYDWQRILREKTLFDVLCGPDFLRQ